MATRSNIGIVNLDKSITAIYVHWGGYPEFVGKMLLNHYNNDDIVNGLMNLGDLSILSELIFVSVNCASVCMSVSGSEVGVSSSINFSSAAFTLAALNRLSMY